MADFRLPLSGFGISNFRSFGSEMQLIGPLKKVNLIVGENNSGKSNISRYVRRVLGDPLRALGADDVSRNLTSARTTIPILTPLDNDFWTRIGVDPTNTHAVQNFNAVFQALKYSKNSPTGFHWFETPCESRPSIEGGSFNVDKFNDRTFDHAFSTVSQILFASARSGGQETRVNEMLNRIAQAIQPNFKSILIPAARKLETRLDQFTDEFGEKKDNANPVIDALLAFSNPIYQRPDDYKKFEKIQHFVRKVLGDDSIKLQVPSDTRTINVQQYDRLLPLEMLGTGVFQSILLAARCTQIENSVVCIEEPELHLHPEVQRQVITYLAEETSNQYFITTHSAHIMDAADCCVIGVHMENGKSIVHHPIDGQQRRNICQRLGYRPSDLIQANSLIWIEGPSDRIYINHWLKNRAPNLREGLHYSYSIYGGKVLSNFSASDEEDIDAKEMNEFIQLLPINRFPAVVMDSDLKRPSDTVRQTKVRLIDELKKISGFSWITAGREIENYISYDMRLSALKNVHKAIRLQKTEAKETKFDHPLAYVKLGETKARVKAFDKVQIAEAVTASPGVLSILDLEKQIDALVDYIKMANRIS